MLTQEIITANELLSALTAEQISAICTLSQNDENTVIAKRISEIYKGLDDDILAASGIGKNGVEKTYDYAKRVLGELKSAADAAKSGQENLLKEKERLEKAIADGDGGAALKQAKADLASITKQYNELNDRFNESEAAHKKEIFDIGVDYALRSASSGLKFKPGLPESVTEVILRQAWEKVKGMSPEEIDDGKGGRLLVFKDADGAIMRNPGNQLNPYTATELLEKELDGMGVLDKGRKMGGNGSQPPRHAPGASLDVSGARTKVEAEAAIRKYLLAKGLTVGSQAYQDEMDKAWKDNGISKLPER